MIDLPELLPLLFVFVGFAAMVLVARYSTTSPSFVKPRFLCFAHFMYRRDLFTEERSFPVIAETAKNIPMDRIESPFTLHIDENRSTLTDGVYVRLRTKIHCQLRAFWFVTIQDFYAELDAPDFRNSLLEDRFLTTKSTHRETFK